jgi:hypothetical protein
MNFWIAVLIGLGCGIVGFPILLFILITIKNTLMRLKVKKMIKKGQFLIPIDEKDFDTKAWTGKKFGNIDLDKNRIDLENLSTKIFTKKLDGNQM